MSTPTVHKVSLDPAALAALNAVSDTPIKALPKPMSAKMINVIHNRVAKTLYGLLMKPTLRQQLIR